MVEKYYLVDTNIIIAYVNHENPYLTNFIDDTHNHFYYTETVEKECGKPVAEKMVIPQIFTKVTANISSIKITNIVESIKTHMCLNLNQKNKFMNDLTIILEAGYVCYDILPKGVYDEPLLLTHNLRLYNKFINDAQNKKMLEDIIGLYGLEHLIEVVRPADVVTGYIV